MKTKIIRDKLALDVRWLKAMAYGLTNPLAVPFTEERKQSLAIYLEQLAERIEEAIAIEDETKY